MSITAFVLVGNGVFYTRPKPSLTPCLPPFPSSPRPLSLPPHPSSRTYHLVIRGLLNAGEGKKALEVAGKAPLALADSTQEMLKTAVEAEAGVQKNTEEQAQGDGVEEGEGEKKKDK